MSILYTPIDIEFELLSFNNLSKWIDENKANNVTLWTHDDVKLNEFGY